MRADSSHWRPPTRRQPTRRQLEVLRVYIRAGSVAAAAYELGISETTVRQHLSGLYRRTGCVNAAQAAYWLGAGQLDRSPGRGDRPVIWISAREADTTEIRPT